MSLRPDGLVRFGKAGYRLEFDHWAGGGVLREPLAAGMKGFAVAAFKEHITVSSLLGVGYGGAMAYNGVEWTHAALGGLLCGFAGMLPDLDSDSGRPLKEIVGATAALVPMLLMHRLEESNLTPEGCVLVAIVIYAAIRFLAPVVFGKLTVHRGMFHSLPAAAIAAQIAYLAHECHEEQGEYVLAAGVLLGFLSHLVLDEIYSVDLHGATIKLKSSAGTALKFFSPSLPATLATWLIAAGLAYVIGARHGYWQPVDQVVNLDQVQSFLR